MAVRGRVQGVMFRDFTRQHARELGLSGYVRNLPDGSVEVVAEGPKEALLSLVRHISNGPPGARVENLEKDWTDTAGHYQGFSIRY